MGVKLSEAEMEAWQALLHAHHHLMGLLESELRSEHSLNMAQYDVLVRLARAPDRSLRMSEIAKRIMVSPSGLTRVVDGLAESGYVERRRDAADSRVVFAELTAQGLEVIRAASRTHLRGIRAHFTSQLSARQLRAVTAALEVIAGPHQPH